MKLTDISVRRPVLTVMMILVFVIIGLFSFQKLTIDLFPRIDIPVITITTIYEGAGPGEVESQVTEKIEDEISTVSNVKHINSTSRENVSIIAVEFELGVDIDLVSIEVKDKVDAILSDLPDEVNPPSIVKFDINALPIMNLSISANRPIDEVYRFADNDMRDRLNKIDGLASVEIVGGLIREVQVDVSKNALIRYGITITELADLIGAENKDVPLGRITKKDGELTLRVKGEFTSIEELSDARFALPSGATIALSDLGTVTDGFEERRESAKFQGKPSVAVIIYKRSDANTVGVATEVFSAIGELRKSMPEGYEIGVARDLSKYIVSSVNDVLGNIILGIIITSFFLYIFLHDLKSTIIASLAMPTSIIATFILMFAGDFTINVITLMALGISIGILATNSIIVLENISRHIDEGEPPEAAAVKGTSEIAVAVMASTLTNVVVFTPIAYMSGIVGQFFKQFGLTVVFATIFSLFVSFTMVPMLASKLLGRGLKRGSEKAVKIGFLGVASKKIKWFFGFWDNYYQKIVDGYRSALTWCLGNPKKTILGTFMLFAFSLFLLGMVGGEFFPSSDQGYLSINVELPPGSTLDETEAVMDEVSSICEKYDEVETLFVVVGGENRGVNEGELIMKLVDISKRNILTSDFVNAIRPDMAVIPSANIKIMESQQGPGGDEADLIVEVTGNEMGTLNTLAEEVKGIVGKIDGLVDVETSVKAPMPEIRFIPDRFKISNYGINSALVYTVLRASFEGKKASVYRETGEEYDIRVRLDETDRSDEDSFGEVMIKTGRGMVPLAQLGEVVPGFGESEILRKDRRKLIEVRANVGTGTIGEYEAKIMDAVKDVDVPEGFNVRLGGESETKAESFAALFEALFMAIILTYIVLAAILESYIHPITIMLTLPLGLIGTAVGLFVSGQTINVMSLMAMVMLVGIVVNNAILILDYTSVLREGGMRRREALLTACPVRFRPIVMTNLAIAFAILPQALGGAEAGFRVTMSVVTIGGVLISAVFTLFLIPVVYEYLDRFTVRGREER